MFGRKKSEPIKPNEAVETPAPEPEAAPPKEMSLKEKREAYGVYPFSEIVKTQLRAQNGPRWRTPSEPDGFDPVCEMCLFWERVYHPEHDDTGRCRRSAPTTNARPDMIYENWPLAYWPYTLSGDRCGQFEIHPDAKLVMDKIKEAEPMLEALDEFFWLLRRTLTPEDSK